MNLNQKSVEEKLKEFNQVVDGLSIPDPGTMANLRKKFHKRLLVSSSFLGLVVAIILILPHLSIMALISTFFLKYLPTILNPLTLILRYAIFIYVFHLISAFVSYYRNWAIFERKVKLILWQLESVSNCVNHVRNEEIRLKALYPQLKDWLEIIGNSLVRPFVIKPEWYLSESQSLTSDSLPYSLRLAHPISDDTTAEIAMQREIAERYLLRGWRAKVFADEIDVIREQVGMAPERLNVEQIDKEITYAPNGPRAIIKKYLSEAEILEKVGKRQLLPLISEVQVNSILETHPPVKEIRKIEEESEQSSIQLYDKNKLNWDDFLKVALPIEGKPKTPLSTLALSDEGKIKNYQDKYETFIICPNRFRDLISHLGNSRFRTYEENSKLPLDIVVRTDFTGPISREHLLFLEKSSEIREREKSELESEIRENLKNRKSGID